MPGFQHLFSLIQCQITIQSPESRKDKRIHNIRTPTSSLQQRLDKSQPTMNSKVQRSVSIAKPVSFQIKRSHNSRSAVNNWHETQSKS